MYKNDIYEIVENIPLTESVNRMKLKGETRYIREAGQFINIKIEGLFLRRPISVADVEGDIITIIYKVVGEGTKEMSEMKKGDKLDILTGLGNGFYTYMSGDKPVLIGGGVGVPPMYLLAKKLLKEKKDVMVIIGFNTKSEIFYEKEFNDLGVKVIVTTVDGSYGIKGYVTEGLKGLDYSFTYVCGPEPMLKAVYDNTTTSGAYSFEKRMACGFGACMGCTCKTKKGNKRICKEGPVLIKEEIIW